MALYGQGAGAAGRGCVLVTLSLNCSVDFPRQRRQDSGARTPGQATTTSSQLAAAPRRHPPGSRSSASDEPTRSPAPECGRTGTIRDSSGSANSLRLDRSCGDAVRITAGRGAGRGQSGGGFGLRLKSRGQTVHQLDVSGPLTDSSRPVGTVFSAVFPANPDWSRRLFHEASPHSSVFMER